MVKFTQALLPMLKHDLTNILLVKGAKFTKMNPPSHIMATKECENRSEAIILEYQIKQLPPAKKRALGLIWNEIN